MSKLVADPSPYDSQGRRELEQAVVDRRREVQARLDDVRLSVERESSWLPTGRDWIKPLMGLAIGVALAKGRRRPVRDLGGPGEDFPEDS